MNILIEKEVFMLVLTMGAFLVGKKLFAKTAFPILNPLLTASALIIALLLLSGIDYAQFRQGTSFIHFLLGPAVVALGLVLYDQIEVVKQQLVPVLISCGVGCVVAIVSVYAICVAFGAERAIIASLQPKSVTTAIALGIAERTGGIPALAAIAVVITGILGAIISPTLFQWMGIRSAKAQGLALGAAAHVMGTSKAIEMGPTQAAFAGLAVGVMGVMTALFVPIFEWIVL